MHNKIGEILLSEDEIIKRSKQLGKQISKDFEGKPLIAVGLLNGCVPFFAELIKHIDIPLKIDFIRVKSYYGGTTSGDLKIVNDLELDVKDAYVLLIDDVVDSGKTMVNIKNFLLLKGAKEVKVCTLLNKPSSHVEEDLVLDYIGFNIGDEFIIGYGLDYDEYYRNLPYVAIFKQD
ncbi:MAG: hypoxanthine phosphoribosyltransferase [Erysipelotrichaceae bacterium]|nr:hypoxanthine phosphoribosyltransferase [Erysipelotrichaceae bacterium]